MLVINSMFVLVALVWGKFVDWVFQTTCQGYWKSKFGENWGKALLALTSHCLVYSTLTGVPLFLLFRLSPHDFTVLWIILFLSHMIIDNRYLVKLIMVVKGVPKEDVADDTKTGWLQLGIDQILHDVFILIASVLIGG